MLASVLPERRKPSENPALETRTSLGKDTAIICVSVVIPTRNRPQLVVKAVASALAQDFENSEVIVVIDGHDPATRDALQNMDDERLRVISLTECAGGAEARNIGVRAAHGEWIAFLDDDDEWLPHKLSRQIVTARRSTALQPVISSRMIVRTPSYEFAGPLRSFRPEKPVSEFLFCRKSLQDGPYAMQTSTLLMRRDLMLAVPFRKGLRKHQDWDWLLRAERVAGVEFAVVDEPLVIYRTEDGRECVGNSQDWEFSLAWGNEMRGAFSARAFSWFLASECASRAAKSGAGVKACVTILRQFLFDGRPSLGSMAMIAAFLGFPHRLREGIRREIRRLRRHRGREVCAAGQRKIHETAEAEF
jgi:glycosyltransferase involved in cell wall biosynthesis